MIVDGRGDAGLKLYVDGELMGRALSAAAVGDIVCANNLFIGFEERNTKWYIGVVDEVRIYSRALDEEEIEANFKSMGMAVEYGSDKLNTTWAKIKKLSE